MVEKKNNELKKMQISKEMILDNIIRIIKINLAPITLESRIKSKMCHHLPKK